MKQIIKQEEPTEFVAWKARANEDWEPTYDGLRGSPTGNIVKKAILHEQGWLCCYCERKIDENNSHIEHFRPQSQFPGESLVYENMLCSCFKEKKRESELHCGHLKGEWFDENLLISPLDPSCESRFSFEVDGRITQSSSDDIAAQTTIERLGLNVGKLIEKRKNLIDIFNGADDETLSESDVEAFTREDQRAFAERYLLQNDDGTFGEFWTTIRFMLEHL